MESVGELVCRFAESHPWLGMLLLLLGFHRSVIVHHYIHLVHFAIGILYAITHFGAEFVAAPFYFNMACMVVLALASTDLLPHLSASYNLTVDRYFGQHSNTDQRFLALSEELERLQREKADMAGELRQLRLYRRNDRNVDALKSQLKGKNSEIVKWKRDAAQLEAQVQKAVPFAQFRNVQAEAKHFREQCNEISSGDALKSALAKAEHYEREFRKQSKVIGDLKREHKAAIDDKCAQINELNREKNVLSARNTGLTSQITEIQRFVSLFNTFKSLIHVYAEQGGLFLQFSLSLVQDLVDRGISAYDLEVDETNFKVHKKFFTNEYHTTRGVLIGGIRGGNTAEYPRLLTFVDGNTNHREVLSRDDAVWWANTDTLLPQAQIALPVQPLALVAPVVAPAQQAFTHFVAPVQQPLVIAAPAQQQSTLRLAAPLQQSPLRTAAPLPQTPVAAPAPSGLDILANLASATSKRSPAPAPSTPAPAQKSVPFWDKSRMASPTTPTSKAPAPAGPAVQSTTPAGDPFALAREANKHKPKVSSPLAGALSQHRPRVPSPLNRKANGVINFTMM